MKIKYLLSSAITAVSIAAMISGCSHSPGPSAPSPPVTGGGQTTVTVAPAQSFNPTVTPPPPSATEKVAAYQGYYFHPQPAPVPQITATVKHHRHRYLHIVIRDHRCYLADNYGHYYDTGRNNDGDVYPVYHDPGTGADYPLYYDQDRDEYYRCVDDDDNGYYRNYVGDPDDDFYQGDPDQAEECQSEQCQPFVVNYDDNYDNYDGYDPSYGHYDGPRYSRHDNDFVQILPVIVAAYIFLQPSHHDHDHNHGDWNNGRQTLIINNHNYYRNTVIVNNQQNGPPNSGRELAAVPGPPIGHFAGYKGARGGAGSGQQGGEHHNQQPTGAIVAIRQSPAGEMHYVNHGQIGVTPGAALVHNGNFAGHPNGGPNAALSGGTHLVSNAHSGQAAPGFRGARQNGRQVMAVGSKRVGPAQANAPGHGPVRGPIIPAHTLHVPNGGRVIPGGPTSPQHFNRPGSASPDHMSPVNRGIVGHQQGVPVQHAAPHSIMRTFTQPGQPSSPAHHQALPVEHQVYQPAVRTETPRPQEHSAPPVEHHYTSQPRTQAPQEHYARPQQQHFAPPQPQRTFQPQQQHFAPPQPQRSFQPQQQHFAPPQQQHSAPQPQQNRGPQPGPMHMNQPQPQHQSAAQGGGQHNNNGNDDNKHH